MADAAHNEEFTAIVLGEPGMGKSCLTFNLAGRPQLEGDRKFLDGMDARGVTKNFEPFAVDLQSKGFVDTLIDTPGLGDQDVKLGEWLAKAEAGFGMVDAIIICVSETNPRITMGAELVSLMIGGGFLRDAKKADPRHKQLLRDKIVLVGTKGNLATKKMRRAMPGVAQEFATKANLKDVGVTYISVDAGDWEEPDWEETPVLVLNKLRTHFRNLNYKIKEMERKGIDTKIRYNKIEGEDLVHMALDCMGIEASEEKVKEVAEQLDFWRNALSGIGNLVIGRWAIAGAQITRAGASLLNGMTDIFECLGFIQNPSYF